MFERYLTDAVTNRFGHVLENLDSDKVRLSAWNGELVLDDVSLRTNALDSFVKDCPLEIGYGRVGNFELRIPWTLFRSQLRWRRETDQPTLLQTGCSIVLTDVDILLTPRRTRSHDEDADNGDEPGSLEEKRRQKEKQVQSLLEADLLKRVTESSAPSSRWSWVQHWLSSLLSTISVTVRNIHVRYEDPGTCLGFAWSSDQDGANVQRYRPSFAVGITLSQFSFGTEDSKKEQPRDDSKAVSEKGDKADAPKTAGDGSVPGGAYEVRLKVAVANKLAIYWDSKCELMSSRITPDEPKEERARHYGSCFQILNASEDSFAGDASFPKPIHTYLLDPFSPTVKLNLISKKTTKEQEAEKVSSQDSDESSTDSTSSPPNKESTPPSSVSINLPPCNFTISRNTLEDTAYIRKSLGVWSQSTKGILSQSSLRRLAKLRPVTSPLEDPRSWWVYASEATLALSRVNRQGRDLDHIENFRKRRRGWLGFIQVVKKRRQYIELYKSLLSASTSGADAEEKSLPHEKLLEMEDELLAEEIVAFRFAVYKEVRAAATSVNVSSADVDDSVAVDTPILTPSKSRGGWKGWVPGISGSGEVEPKTQTVRVNDQNILSIDNRLWMMDEVIQALDREESNRRSRFRDVERRASVRQVVIVNPIVEESNPKVWSASLVCQEFAIQVNDEISRRRGSVLHSSYLQRGISPVIRLSTAWLQQHCWYQDGSWDSDCYLGNLAVKDLTWSTNKGSANDYFPNLIGRKQGTATHDDDDFLVINSEEYHRSVSIIVQRKLHWKSDTGEIYRTVAERGSTTKFKVRILPMEVVYATLPVEALSRVLASIKTPELADDYHKISSAAHEWRERQRRKFLQTLANKRKKIIVDLDVGAPELLIPEAFNKPESPMLAVDLGRFQVFNDSSELASTEYDDQWRLVLSDIQVQSTTIANYFQSISRPAEAKVHSDPPEGVASRKLVEPFSLDFTISTRIISADDTKQSDEQTRARVTATLPRLAFNFTSSSLRLVLRLQQQWERRKSEMHARISQQQQQQQQQQQRQSQAPITLISPSKTFGSSFRSVATEQSPSPSRGKSSRTHSTSASRVVEWQFSAPLITLRLENDVDGRDSLRRKFTSGDPDNLPVQTPLVDLAFRGIRGRVVQQVKNRTEYLLSFDARLHSLGAIDLYQTAGNDFALLMSSVPRQFLKGKMADKAPLSWEELEISDYENVSTGGQIKDLVSIEYSSRSNTSDDEIETFPDKLSIWFHELYVEWNPETIAAIQKAVRMPMNPTDDGAPNADGGRGMYDSMSISDDEFFDAHEDEFFDAGSETNSAIHLISEISSTTEQSELPQDTSPDEMDTRLSSSGLRLGLQRSLSLPNAPMSPISYGHKQVLDVEKKPSPPKKPIEVVFELSKLRVSFNKESRHRRVIVAQMDRTSVSYATRKTGGSNTNMSMGNFVLLDPSTADNTTLYGQIVGLQSSSDDTKRVTSSLLQMELLINPRDRQFSTDLDLSETDVKNQVIDREKGVLKGYNYCFRAKFSPMRFVFLEQLWFEIMDYFFEGIIGTEVWGGKKATLKSIDRNQPLPPVPDPRYLHGSDAEGVTFTRFDISLESPEVLLPVGHASPHFIKLELDRIGIANRYTGDVVPYVTTESTSDRMQWFNNCDISLKSLNLFSWCGRNLGKEPLSAEIALRWPTGPLAPLIIPKWNVSCQFDSLDISLRKSDYALLQNIITYNIGEKPRHLDEWEALQSLSPNELDLYRTTTLVHFGYDKKDVAPTTYDLKVSIPSLSFSLLETDNDHPVPIAIARCTKLQWQLRKESDRVVRQRLTCSIDLVTPTEDSKFERMLSLTGDDDEDDNGNDDKSRAKTPGIQQDGNELTYTSTTKPTSDNIKTLEIVEASIYMIVPAWKRFIAFFGSLSPPVFFNEEDIGASIQVGNRWYRIGGGDFLAEKPDVVVKKEKHFKWIAAQMFESLNLKKSASRSSFLQQTPTYQLKVLLTSPRIILTSVPDEGCITRLVLSMRHLEFLHTNRGDTGRVQRSLFLHDVEVYTSTSKKTHRKVGEGANSLIHPWSVVALIDKCNEQNVGNCASHSVVVSGDVLKVRAAYSDMAIAIDVCLSVLSTSKTKAQGGAESHLSSTSKDSTDSSTTKPQLPASDASDAVNSKTPTKALFRAALDGFELRVADDSGRHFAGNQDLMILALGKILFSKEDSDDGTSATQLRLHSLELFDCLQADTSPFRLAASSRKANMGLESRVTDNRSAEVAGNTTAQTQGAMDWEDYRATKDGKLNFATSTALSERSQRTDSECSFQDVPSGDFSHLNVQELIEFSSVSLGNGSQEYRIKLRSFALQWNPSTVIAVQRFLGRLRKESRTKADQVFHQDLDEIVSHPSRESGREGNTNTANSTAVGQATRIRATFEVDSLTVCLNKEHQKRRLLELTLSACHLELSSSENGLHVHGELGDLYAWDTDTSYKAGILPRNRSILNVISSSATPQLPGSGEKKNSFLTVNYSTFKKEGNSIQHRRELPDWVESHVSNIWEIDDFLSLTVASVQFTFLRDRTEEILDYLSNGLPGKGMGATSRAAKGFLSKRIVTKSFLELKVDSPQIRIPQHESALHGFVLELGDASVRSWFEEATVPKHVEPSGEEEWWRILSLGISGFCVGVMNDRPDAKQLSPVTNPIDLQIVLRKPTVKGRELALRGTLSFVDLKLTYNEYVLLRAVAHDNLAHKVDKDKWDNVEKAYWLEEENADVLTQQDSDEGENGSDSGHSTVKHTDGRVTYSSNARFVRYGTAGAQQRKVNQKNSMNGSQGLSSPRQAGSPPANTLDVRFELDGLSLKLNRDDTIQGVKDDEKLASAFYYDMMLLKVQLVEVSVTANASGDMSFHLSLFRIGLFDLGDKGRLMRERYYSSLPNAEFARKKGKRKNPRQPCPFHVLAEGYAPDEENMASPNRSDSAVDGPQFVVTVDRCPASSTGVIGSLSDYQLPRDSKVTVARVVINFLSVNAMIRPFKEIVAFLSCEWPSRHSHRTLPTEAGEGKNEISNAVNDDEIEPKTSRNRGESRGFQLKLVAHYPRLFFLADECDPHSRALVLRGLAVVNLSKMTIVKDEDVQEVTAVDAQMHSMESYINPDVHEALRLNHRHVEMIGDSYSTLLPVPIEEQSFVGIDTQNLLGVALIQPVTTGIEYCEIRRDLFPTQRSVFVNIEPLSTMLSFEDLELIEAVMKRWSSARGSKAAAAEAAGASKSGRQPRSDGDVHSQEDDRYRLVRYEVVFHGDRLGLGLKADSDKILVSSIQNSEHSTKITPGDTLLAIDDYSCEGKTLPEIVGYLAEAKRPTRIMFRRNEPTQGFRAISAETNRPQRNKSQDTAAADSADGPQSSESENLHEIFARSYTIRFRAGLPHGLRLERSPCGQLPVITAILPEFDSAALSSAIDETNSEQIEATFQQEEAPYPRVGAVISGINGTALDDVGLTEAWSFLSGREERDSDTSSVTGADAKFYSLDFKEVDSSLWGTIDTFDVSSSGITLSFIDDLKGRDMPLFQGKFSGVEIHAERGLGVDSRILEFTSPSFLLDLQYDPKALNTQLALTDEEYTDFLSEAVLTFSGIAKCSIDYFHPRIACWEPLVEQSQLFLLCERQTGSDRSGRPGQLALEVSDRLLHDQSFRGNTSIGEIASPHMVTCNLTDAAAEVIGKSMQQWSAWRNGVMDEAEDEEDISMIEPVIRDVTVFPERTVLVSATSDVSDFQAYHDVVGSPVSEITQRQNEAEHAAAQQAAKAALVFAQKRGADTTKEGDGAKPFIFRNRTGVSIAFAQEKARIGGSSRQFHSFSTSSRNLSVVGEYVGLESYDPATVMELADQEDARFNMELISDPIGTEEDTSDGPSGARSNLNKIRNYEGHFPSLTVAIQAVAGVLVDPIEDLPVYKVGSSVRHLIVTKEVDLSLYDDDETCQYSIPIVWKVEIEDNRRILTLSTAVRVVTTGYNAPIEVGFRSMDARGPAVSVGISRPGSPFYLPLWLALKLEAVSVYVRPGAGMGTRYEWGETSVLEFSSSADSTNMSVSGRSAITHTGVWVWTENFDGLGSVRCPAFDEPNSVWLSVFGSSRKGKAHSGSSVSSRRPGKGNDPFATPELDEETTEVITVTVDSGLTLRNLLPMSIDWEVACVVPLGSNLTLDGNLRRGSMVSENASTVFFSDEQNELHSSLGSGECTEVFACDFLSHTLEARFKEPYAEKWSTWAPLMLLENDEKLESNDVDDGDETFMGILPATRQVNVQVSNEGFGAPLTFGVRIIPKMTSSAIEDPSRGRTYGLEVIIFAELWIRNLTALPLNFGCPSYQLHESGDASRGVLGISDESAARFTAESALMEIASLLEVGDKGTGLSNRAAREVAETGNIESLPNQVCSVVVEELFEYLEIEASTVKRRWWGSESYDSYRENSLQTTSPGTWRWIDEKWAIDCSGHVRASLGGWESCRNLLAGAGSFSPSRDFDPAHAIRRRRYFRNRTGRSTYQHTAEHGYGSTPSVGQQNILLGGLQAIHQPLQDSFSKEQRKLKSKSKKKKRAGSKDKDDKVDDAPMKMAVKCGDGKWSLPVVLPDSGTCHGVIRVVASRWPTLTRSRATAHDSTGELKLSEDGPSEYTCRPAHLSPDMYELCYSVTDAEGEWGEFSRSMVLSPRYLLRNDSDAYTFEIKQTGAPDATSMRLKPGEVQPFYWADFRLPGLVSVHPLVYDDSGYIQYKWSGGFDLCNLGMIPIRLRHNGNGNDTSASGVLRSLRALVEIRPGTGGTGINISFREEDPRGDGSLFRIENQSTFPIWFSQDGVLANPLSNAIVGADVGRSDGSTGSLSPRRFDGHGEGDMIHPSERMSFALDVPYRQGKYAHRKEASMSELLHVRVSLAPLSSRAGIETVKVIGLTTVGESIRLNPSKLQGALRNETRSNLERVRVMGVITTDGPTRVLKFCLMQIPSIDVFSAPFGDVSYIATNPKRSERLKPTEWSVETQNEMVNGAIEAIAKLRTKKLMTEEEARRHMIFGVEEVASASASESDTPGREDVAADQIYSFRAEFSGFLFSFVDSAPSEVAVATLRNVNALARWNSQRTSDASFIVSIGWLQFDNHVPNAPFKVAIRPETIAKAVENDDNKAEVEINHEVGAPLLVVALALAPKHKSGIVCLRSITIAPSNLVIAVDLAFLVRFQRFLVGFTGHLKNRPSDDSGISRGGPSGMGAEQKRFIPFPEHETSEQALQRAAAFGLENQKMYFQSLTILPCNIKLSVGPARALTASQASLEGKETAAIHQAVRKGDVLVGSSSALLGVRIGRKNTTPLAVVRGVFKSILVDALLRLDGASLNFAGVYLKNHISSGPQLTTYLMAHYLSSLRQNVPALLGSLAAFGNPLGLIRGIGDGMSDFVSEPVKGLKKSVKKLDPTFLVDGVARGTESLARHAVGGFADSASLLTETFSKNMAVLTLDRRYAQKRDRGKSLRLHGETTVTLAAGVESGFVKLVHGFMDGVTGVVKAPIRGAEKKGIEGFAKGVGKGLLGLLVKPMIGISDAATDVMIGVKRSVESNAKQKQNLALTSNQFRPRRPMYGRDKVLRPFKLDDAVAATLMLGSRCAGENYLGHMDMGDRVALLSVRRLILLGPSGQELLALKYTHVSKVEVRAIKQEDGRDGWGIIIVLNKPRRNGSEVEVISFKQREQALELRALVKRGMELVDNEQT